MVNAAMMMNKEFIPYEDNIVLIELGLDINDGLGYFDCINHYFDEDKDLFSVREMDDIEDNWIPAITFSQAFRFFREKYNLWVEISKPKTWLLSISDKKQNKRILLEDYDNYVEPTSYEEAELSCFKKLIEIVKNKTPQRKG